MLLAEVYISLAVHWDEVDMGMRNLQTQYYLSYLLAWEGCLDDARHRRRNSFPAGILYSRRAGGITADL